MTETEKQQIRKIIRVLQDIDNGVKVFFNITVYERLGLVTSRKKWGVNPAGKKVLIGHSFHLTEKSKRYLKVVL